MKLDLDALQATLNDCDGPTFWLLKTDLQGLIDRLRKAEAAQAQYLSEQKIASLIYKHTGISDQQFPDEYADQRKLVKAVIEACMDAAPDSEGSEK